MVDIRTITEDLGMRGWKVFHMLRRGHAAPMALGIAIGLVAGAVFSPSRVRAVPAPASVGTATRVTGLGGVFFKASDPAALREWYERHLGIGPALPADATFPQGTVAFSWRDVRDPARRGHTVWGPFRHDTRYFDPSSKEFMFNYRVDDLDAVLAALRHEGVAVDERLEEYEYGRFAWLTDPEGNRIELWEPAVNH